MKLQPKHMKNSNSDSTISSKTQNPKKVRRFPLEIVTIILIGLFCLYLIGTGNNIESFREKHGHLHTSHHGGVLVCVGMHKAHLELLHDPESGELTVHVLDDQGENYYFLDLIDLPLQIKPHNARAWVDITLPAVEDVSIGSRLGRSCIFQGIVPELVSQERFQIRIPDLEFFGNLYPSFVVSYPEGSH